MVDGFLADAAQIRRHAAQVDAVRARFGAVRSASAHIVQNGDAYGLLCSWIPAILESRHVRHDSLLAYVEENLALAADALTQSAGAYERTDDSAARNIRKAAGA
jgi:Excreted virulence factor EspC, type VII ESX diderm